ncbi:MAG: metalloregulator ArsR/SmtB family transcription factor [Anaerolineae bacterium]
MLPDLIVAPLRLGVQFDFSLPHDLFTTLSLIAKSPWREGLSEWVYESAAAMGAERRVELGTLTPFFGEVIQGPSAALASVPQQHPAWQDLDALQRYLDGQPASFFASLGQSFLERVRKCEAEQGVVSAATLPVRDVLELHAESQRERRSLTQLDFDPEWATALVEQPEALRHSLTEMLAWFGSGIYLPALGQDDALLSRALAYHRRQRYVGRIEDVFGAVTGRNLPPESSATLASAHSVQFVPSSHIGPYFFIVVTGRRAYVSFNARTVGAGSPVSPAIPDIVQMFPRLKALADETRLHILAHLQAGEATQEMIVAALGISQPAASRHLGLMERTSLLSVRRENGLKYYSIRRENGREFVAALDSFLG